MSEASQEIQVFVGDLPTPTDPETLPDEPRPIAIGESFLGGMPILSWKDHLRFFREKARDLYGEPVGGGKWGVVLLLPDRATKFFKQPSNILSAYEVEFMKRYGGVAGLPKFVGVVPDGYQMERIEGVSLTTVVNREFHNRGSEDPREVWARVLTPTQVQELLDKVAEFHRVTGRVHGDLGHWDDIIIEPDGGIRITDPEWERIGDQTPRGELGSLYSFFTETAGFENLVLPDTISDEKARENLDRFKEEVVEKVESNNELGIGKIRFRDQKIDIKIGEDGQVLVSRRRPNE